jgi:hypothetical protein
VQPLVWARVVYSRQAWQLRLEMSDVYRRLLDIAIDFIKNGPDDGIPVGEDDADGTVIRQVSVQDLQVQYTVKYWPIGRALLITTIELRHWEPLDDTPTLGTKGPQRQ